MNEPIKFEKETTKEFGLTYEEIAQRMGISRERVRQIKETALKKMRKEIIKHKDEFGDF